MCVCVCVCVCACVYVRACVCVCVCVLQWWGAWVGVFFIVRDSTYPLLHIIDQHGVGSDNVGSATSFQYLLNQ